MRSNQIRTIQKRTKQRALALAICAFACGGYGAMSLFADDPISVTKTVASLKKVPAVRSVGIRLINPNGSEPSSVLPTPSSVLPTPSSVLPTPSSVLPTPSSVLPTPSSVLPTPSSAPNALFPPAMTPTAETKLTPISPAVRAELPPPPSMADLLNQNTNGRVLVKLSGDKTQSSSGSAGVQVVQHLQSVKPVVQESNNTHLNFAASEIAMVASKEPIRVSFDDYAKSEVPTNLSIASAGATVAKNRLPEQIKPKSTKITHTVSLAQSTEIDLPQPVHDMDEVSTTSPPTAVVAKTQLASQLPGKSIEDSRSNANDRPDGFVSLAPPSLSQLNASTSEVKQIGGATPPLKLDARWANGTPSAIIELESRTAKAVDIPGGIKAITIENEDVCRVLYDTKTISLVGNQSGTTLVQIWTSEAKETPIFVRVNVSQPWQKSNSKPTDVPDVKLAVAQAFPNAKVDVFTNADGTIEVRGTTDSEDSAIRILEIVRKVCLVPVKDNVTVTR